MRTLNEREVALVSGGGDNVWYNIGYAVGTAYGSAISATADFFCYIDALDGSLSD